MPTRFPTLCTTSRTMRSSTSAKSSATWRAVVGEMPKERFALGAEIAPEVDLMKLATPYLLRFLAAKEP